MAVFQYKHEWCGMDQQIFLDNIDKDRVIVPCYRCGRDVEARQIRDKSIKIGEADGQVGILRRENKDVKTRRRGSE